MPETTPLIKAALNLRVGAGFDVYHHLALHSDKNYCTLENVETVNEFAPLFRKDAYSAPSGI